MSVRLCISVFLYIFIASAYGGCPEIVTRTAWGARVPNSRQQMKVPVSHVFLHHTKGTTCNSKDTCSKVMRQTQNFHMDTRKWADISYSFLVGGDGRIYEGRGWQVVGAHTTNYNSQSIAISFMGNYHKALPNNAMITASKKLIDCGVEMGVITRNRQIHGHRDAGCTECPGTALYQNIKSWTGFKAGELPGYFCLKG